MDLEVFAKDLIEMKLRNRTWVRVWDDFMKKYKCEYICELGVSKGANFHEMIKTKPKLAVAIDAWIEDGVISRNDSRFSQAELDRQCQEFMTSVADKPFVKVCREYTFDAVKRFPDNYFDLVYIDADHSYEGCLRDIEDWFPKVKTGKFLFGDDYQIYEGRHAGIKFGVIEAVNEFVKKNNLQLFFTRNKGWCLIKK